MPRGYPLRVKIVVADPPGEAIKNTARGQLATTGAAQDINRAGQQNTDVFGHENVDLEHGGDLDGGWWAIG